MNKFSKIILVAIIAVAGAGFLLALPAKATVVEELIVEYSSDGGATWSFLSAGSVFNETNFLPGQDVTRLIRVTNNSEPTQRIAMEAINKINVGDLASQLDIVIKESGSTIYSKTLKQFFDDGEIYLSSLVGLGGQTQYDFKVSFKSGADNDYQGKSAGFDLLVGFEGTEGGLGLPLPGGSANNGGGGLPPGLTIIKEAATSTTQTTATITWLTSYAATSQVIYGTASEKHILNLTDTGGSLPKYGYEHTTPEYDTSPKKTGHSVTISGLTPGTTYYYRAVSHASLAISQEHSFTTLSPSEQTQAPIGPAEQTQTGGLLAESGGGGLRPSVGAVSGEEQQTQETAGQAGEEQAGKAEEVKKESKNNLFAVIGSFFGQNWWILLIIFLLVLLILFILWFFRRRGKKEEQKNSSQLPKQF